MFQRRRVAGLHRACKLYASSGRLEIHACFEVLSTGSLVFSSICIQGRGHDGPQEPVQGGTYERRAKGSYDLEPVRVHTPKRIESFLFPFKIALRIVVLIGRTARRNIGTREKGLDGFMPNRKDVGNPKTEYPLAEFQYVVKGEIPLPNGNCNGFVSELTELQKDILEILEMPASCFTYSSLF